MILPRNIAVRVNVLRYFDFGTKRKMRRSEGYAPGLLRRKQVYEMETSDFLADGCDRAALQPGGDRMRDGWQYTFRQPDGVRDPANLITATPLWQISTQNFFLTIAPYFIVTAIGFRNLALGTTGMLLAALVLGFVIGRK